MLKLTKTGIGLLTRLYRSVLQKCWLINIGVWALGAVGKTVSTLLPQTLRGTFSIFVEKIEKVLANLLKCNFLNDANILKLLDIKLTQSEAAKNGANTFGKMTNVPSAELLTSPSEGTSFAINAKEVLDSLLQTNSFCIKKKNLTISTALVTSLAFAGVMMCPSSAVADSLTAQEILSYLGTVSNGVATGTTGHTEWTNSGSSVQNFGWEGQTYGSGTMKIGDYWYTYTYTIPNNYTYAYTALGNNLTKDNITNKTFSEITSTIISITNNNNDNDIVSDFVKNIMKNGAHAITRDSGATTFGSVYGDFIANSSSVTGSTTWLNGIALYANQLSLGDITGDFIGNSSSGQYRTNGGLIHLTNNCSINNITGNFIGNVATLTSGNGYIFGGIIASYGDAFINKIEGNFIGNRADTSRGNNGIRSYGGVLYLGSLINTIKGNFLYNSAYGKNSRGGVFDIAPEGEITNVYGKFIGNYAESIIATNAHGGAIYNDGIINNISADFSDNYVTTSAGALGGAIENSGTINISNSSFINNYVSGNSSSKGGAIFNNGSIDFTGTNIFSGNYINSTSNLNDIYNEGTINVARGITTFNSGYIGSSAANLNVKPEAILTMNSALSGGNLTNEGTVNIGASDLLADTITNNGTLNLGDGMLSQTVSGSGDLVIGGMVTMSSATTGGKLIFSNDSSDYVNGIAATKAEIVSGDQYDIVTAAAVRDYISEYGGGSSIDVDTTFDKTSTNPATSTAIANFLDTNYSRKLTKTTAFCDGLDERFTADYEGKIEPDLEDKITLDFEDKINESPLDLAQIVKGSTDSKASAQSASIVGVRIGGTLDGLYDNLIKKAEATSKTSAQSASIVGVRIGGTLDGLYDNLIKKAEDPLTHSPFGSARDDNITFAAANDNTNYKQGGTINNEANTFSETTENVPAPEMHKIRQSRGISSFFRRNNEDMMEKISQSAANTQKINITTTRAA